MMNDNDEQRSEYQVALASTFLLLADAPDS
jgi:hypothetical protein